MKEERPGKIYTPEEVAAMGVQPMDVIVTDLVLNTNSICLPGEPAEGGGVRIRLSELTSDNLRDLVEVANAELKERAKKARAMAPRPKGEFMYWDGRVTKVFGKSHLTAHYRIEPIGIVPPVSSGGKLLDFAAQANAFSKHHKPEAGDIVRLRYRIIKGHPSDFHFWDSRVCEIVE